MRSPALYIIWICWFLISCQSQELPTLTTNPLNTKDTIVNPPKKAYQPDSLELAYFNKKYFFPNRLRLEGKNPGCIFFYDTSFTQRERIDSSDWERYQDSIRPLLSPDVLRAHQGYLGSSGNAGRKVRAMWLFG
jgi:hypothetical protein